MMKWFLALIALLITKTSFSQYNDWTEYGLKGKVRLIEATVFDTAVYDGKTWKVVDPNTFFYKRSYHFNTNGFIDSIITSTSERVTSRVTFTWDNGSRIGHASADNPGKFTNTMVFEWKSKYSYQYIERDTAGEIKTKSITWLNKNFRDRAGEFWVYGEGKLMTHKKYQNVLGENDLLLKAIWKDYVNDYKYEVEYKHQTFDAFGNPVQTVLYDSTYGFVEQMLIRSISYY